MKGLQYALLAGLVIVVIVSLVAAQFVMQAAGFDLKDYTGIVPELGETGDESIFESPTGVTTSENSVEEIDRSFSDSTTGYDMSEIACRIGESIYADFSVYGASPTRTVEGKSESEYVFTNDIPLEGRIGYLLDSGEFVYKEVASTNPSDEAKLNSEHASCHLCTYESGGTKGITKLDEVCINKQLKDRMVSSDPFCGPASGSALIKPSQSATWVGFGNNNCLVKDSASGWGSYCDGEDNDGSDFCDNEQDRIEWYANSYQNWGGNWKVKNTDYKYAESGDSQFLSGGWKYVYGLLWTDKDKYSVIFSMIPNPDSREPATGFSDITAVLGDSTFIRYDVLGNKYSEARFVADFKVTPGNSVSGGDITKELGDALTAGDYNKIHWNPCTGQNCIADPINVEEDCTVDSDIYGNADWYTIESKIGGTGLSLYQGKDIYIKTNVAGIIDGSNTFEAGKTYRVIVQNWINAGRKQKPNWIGIQYWYTCFSKVARSVSIIEVKPKVTWTIRVEGSNPGEICVKYQDEINNIKTECTKTSLGVEIETGKAASITATPDDSSKYTCFQSAGSTKVCKGTPGEYTLNNNVVSTAGTITASFYNTAQ